MSPTRLLLSLLALLLWAASLPAAEPPEPSTRSRAVERIAAQVGESVAVVTVLGRDGERQGLGTGFIISEDGLIATNLHVIGEARPIRARLADGREFDAVEVHASDRALDLAIIRIDAKGLPALKLGAADQLKQGQTVVAFGNPRGLDHSVVAGVLSSKREIDGREMLQLAIPIEPGNSGGPVVDLQGRVQGIVTMKSAVTDNLGFAVPIDALRPLIERPNPVPMKRWLTIGALDAEQWQTVFGGRWRQRAGHIFAGEPGEGFGGRTLCLSQAELPKRPFEVAVSVRLEDESGAAGLVFCADGGDAHYGFYPSDGKLRLTRFEGPSVFTWTVLAEKESEHYRPGRWNHLKVRLEKGRIQCFVNDHLVIDSTDHLLAPGKAGLAKFRDTRAEFKGFEAAKKIAPSQLALEAVERLNEQIAALPPLEHLLPEQLTPLAEAEGSTRLLRERAAQLERRAAQMRRLADDVRTRRVALLLAEQLRQEPVDLARAALLVARLDDGEVDVEAYLEELDRMAEAIRASLPKDADGAARLAALDEYLFEQQGFHGSRTDYYHRANSYLNRVIDDREGLPITLSVLYMELGRRLGLKIEGVPLPGHFIARAEPAEGERVLIDVFDRGKRLDRKAAVLKALAHAGQPPEKEDFVASPPRDIIRRMLANLLGIAQREGDKEAMLRYLEAIVTIDPDSIADRGMRAMLRFQTGRRAAAVADLDWILDHQPPGLDLERIRQMRAYMREN